MATATAMFAMSADGDKSVHPFFSRQQGFGQNAHDKTRVHEDEGENILEDQPEKPRRTNSKRKKPKDDQKKTQKTLGEIVNPKAVAPAAATLQTSEPDINQGRRKRRRTNDRQAVDIESEDRHAASGAEDERETAMKEGRGSPIVLIPASSPLPPKLAASVQPGSSETAAPDTPPKKLLRLNSHGKFSSPPTKKSKDEDESERPAARRSTRQRKSTKPSSAKQLVVELRYDRDDSKRQEIGERIQRILDDEERIPLEMKTTSKKRTPRKSKPSKPTHPFFSKGGNEAQQKPSTKHESPRKPSAVTPGRLRRETLGHRVDDSQDANHVFTSALLKDRQMIKHPGAKEAPFPAKEQAHIRDLNERDLDKHRASSLSVRQRKRKQATLPFPEGHSLLSTFASQLVAEDERILRADGFHEPAASLNLPQRLLISGQEIAERIASEISVPLIDNDDFDELSSSPKRYTHPALRRLHSKIPTVLTAFDESRGEAQAWSQKYAPPTSADILQPEKEMAILKDWMKSLAVQSVVGAAAPTSKVASSKAAEKPKKKRKKKSDEMDDFLVDDDEEVHDMSEVLDDSNGANGSARRTAHSVVQAVDDGTKLSNAVLLSGPHGCGKTAAAYAVARELGFKVFEISSSERRSGRDVMDRVGDMTANHLVKHHGVEDAGQLSSTEEPSRMEEAFQKDLESGRQGKMSSFFKPQTVSKKQPAPKKVVKEKVVKAVQEALKKPAKDQQQSLILLEEVDVLFKDDKDFWSTIFNLMATSKRPFIMTCNDEDLVPLQAMTLHAILRFAEPSVDLAADYMLLLAAAEGHLLKRAAVTSLYEQQGHDLRASITELDYWCQMGVGDPRGGLAWIYQRWPPGSDVDDQGRQLRVVSDGTYQQGMGLPAQTESTEDALLWMWSEYGIEPSMALGWQSNSHEGHLTADTTVEERLAELKRFGGLAEALSAADACSTNGMSGPTLLDTTQPDMSDKARRNYIDGLALLQTDEQVEWIDMNSELLATFAASAYRIFNAGKLDEDNLVQRTLSRRQRKQEEDLISRRAFACFDTIAVPSELSLTGPGLQQSAFDGTFETIALDLAPYVRSIVQYDQALEEQRERLHLFTSDRRRPKRARTTRAARGAVEGGQRATVRRERWFSKKLDMTAVLATGGQTWPRLTGIAETASIGSKASTEAGTPPASMEENEEIKYE